MLQDNYHHSKPVTYKIVHSFRLPVFAICLALAIISCNLSGGEQIPITDAPTYTPTILPTLTPLPSATPTIVPQSTATQLPTPTATREEAPTPCGREYFFQPSPPICPGAEATASAAAEQPFEDGVMIWLGATDSIYVFYDDQRWQRFDDLWDEDQITSDTSIIPPADRFQPIRGFGKVWREIDGVREKIGWALGPELGFDSLIQESVEVDGASVLFIGTFNGQVFALTNHGLDQGDWAIASSQ